jgi:DNA uptake protein ComE-like DNA-binding protein
MRPLFFILFSTAAASLVSAQEQLFTDTSYFWEDNRWEKILETALQADENSSAAEEITQLEDEPLNLNTATAEELHRIPAVTQLIASRIIERRKCGRFTSIDELGEVEGITPEVISFIRRFLKIPRSKGVSNMKVSFLSRTSSTMEDRQGYINGAYPGSAAKVLNRFRLSVGNDQSPFTSAISEMEAGMLTEKDPGERSLANFSTYFAGFSIPPLAARMVIGDYQMEAAEGLVFWSASSFGKGSDVIASARKNGDGFHPYLSSGENSFFRGAAVSVGSEKGQVQVLYSNKPLNASKDSLGNISTLDESGLFRTENEQRKQNSSRETLIGCRATAYLFDGLKIGGSWYRTRFANPLILAGTNGEFVSEAWMHGVDISFTNKQVDVFSEFALDRTSALAGIAGITYEPAGAVALTIAARHYPPAFQSIHGNAFGESSGHVQNESGVYVGMRALLSPGFWFSMYYDQFEHPRPTYFIPTPSHGSDFLALGEYKFSEQFGIAFRFKRKDSPSSVDEGDWYGRLVRRTIPRIQQNYRFTGEFISSSSLRLSSKFEWVNVHYDGLQNSEKGVLMSETVKWNVVNRLTLQARIAVFETDSFNSALYEFEEEVPGAYSNPALYGSGVRWYCILRYQIFSKMDIAARYAQTVKEGVRSIGTGNDEIRGDTQSLVSMQLELRF